VEVTPDVTINLFDIDGTDNWLGGDIGDPVRSGGNLPISGGAASKTLGDPAMEGAADAGRSLIFPPDGNNPSRLNSVRKNASRLNSLRAGLATRRHIVALGRSQSCRTHEASEQ